MVPQQPPTPPPWRIIPTGLQTATDPELAYAATQVDGMGVDDVQADAADDQADAADDQAGVDDVQADAMADAATRVEAAIDSVEATQVHAAPDLAEWASKAYAPDTDDGSDAAAIQSMDPLLRAVMKQRQD